MGLMSVAKILSTSFPSLIAPFSFVFTMESSSDDDLNLNFSKLEFFQKVRFYKFSSSEGPDTSMMIITCYSD